MAKYNNFAKLNLLFSPNNKQKQNQPQIIKGCHYMHSCNIIHRDLKTANILVTRSGQIKIADWGLARSWNKSATRLTPVVCTLWYRSPEVLLGNRNYTAAMDMWR